MMFTNIYMEVFNDLDWLFSPGTVGITNIGEWTKLEKNRKNSKVKGWKHILKRSNRQFTTGNLGLLDNRKL